MAFLDIQQRLEGAATIVSLNGEIDKSTVEKFKTTLIPPVDSATSPKFLLDCANLKFINSEGIGLFMSFHAKLAKKEKKLLLIGIQPQVKDVFELIGLTRLIPVFPDVASALAP